MNNINKTVATGKEFLSKLFKPAIIVGTSLILSGCNILNQINGLSTGEKVTGGVAATALLVFGGIKLGQYIRDKVYERRYLNFIIKKYSKIDGPFGS